MTVCMRTCAKWGEMQSVGTTESAGGWQTSADKLGEARSERRFRTQRRSGALKAGWTSRWTQMKATSTWTSWCQQWLQRVRQNSREGNATLTGRFAERWQANSSDTALRSLRLPSPMRGGSQQAQRVSFGSWLGPWTQVTWRRHSRPSGRRFSTWSCKGRQSWPRRHEARRGQDRGHLHAQVCAVAQVGDGARILQTARCRAGAELRSSSLLYNGDDARAQILQSAHKPGQC